MSTFAAPQWITQAIVVLLAIGATGMIGLVFVAGVLPGMLLGLLLVGDADRALGDAFAKVAGQAFVEGGIVLGNRDEALLEDAALCHNLQRSGDTWLGDPMEIAFAEFAIDSISRSVVARSRALRTASRESVSSRIGAASVMVVQAQGVGVLREAVPHRAVG